MPGVNRSETGKMEDFCRDNGLDLQRIHHYSLQSTGERAAPGMEAERPLACSKCNRIRLTADGKLKPCLFSEHEFPVDWSDIRRQPEAGAIENKPATGLVLHQSRELADRRINETQSHRFRRQSRDGRHRRQAGHPPSSHGPRKDHPAARDHRSGRTQPDPEGRRAGRSPGSPPSAAAKKRPT